MHNGQEDVLDRGAVNRGRYLAWSIWKNGWVQSLDWTTGLDYWIDPNCKIPIIQCRI